MPNRTITNNTADIYTADLMFEDHGKCYTTKVLIPADAEWNRSADTDDYAGCWKIVILQPETQLDELEADNLEVADCTKLKAVTFAEGTELMGNVFSKVSVSAGMVILYLDCHNS
jgi:hypothetical protein